MIRVLKFLFAVVAIPFAWAIARAFTDVLRAVPETPGFIVPPGILALFTGLVAFFCVWITKLQMMRIYVFGHELTHAIAALCFGAKVSNLRVTAHGGSVMVTKSNTLITLAPYFFPFYTIFVVLAAVVVRCFMRDLPFSPAWLFAVGFTWCFHLCFTIHSILQEQPDLRECGYLFSYVLIWIFNVTGASAWLAGTAGVPWKTFARSVFARSESAYASVWSAMAWSYEFIRSLPFLQG